MATVSGELGAVPPETAEPDDPAGPRFQPVAIRGPALIVLGIAVLIVVAGVIGSALQSSPAPSSPLGAVAIPGGAVVPLAPAKTAMRSIVHAGQPPADIMGNLAVPAGSRVVRSLNTDQGQTQFDRTVSFTTRLTTDQVSEVFRTLLPRLGWRVIYSGPATGQAGARTEVLAKKGSSDGFYWEVGAVVSPTTSAGATPFSVELFQLNDDNS
jgi:hypothetical protein